MINNKLLIKKDDTLEIKIYLGVDKEDRLLAHADKPKLLESGAVVTPEDELLVVTMFFRKPSYKDEVDVIGSALSQKVDATGESFSINPAAIKYSRFIQLFTDWDLKDDEGKKIPANLDNVDSMHPALAGAAIEALEEALQ